MLIQKEEIVNSLNSILIKPVFIQKTLTMVFEKLDSGFKEIVN
jgi:hypothetical protein